MRNKTIAENQSLAGETGWFEVVFVFFDRSSTMSVVAPHSFAACAAGLFLAAVSPSAPYSSKHSMTSLIDGLCPGRRGTLHYVRSLGSAPRSSANLSGKHVRIISLPRHNVTYYSLGFRLKSGSLRLKELYGCHGSALESRA